MGSEKKFDIVILGASGFTGKFVVEEIANLLRDKKIESFTWAVAGRSKDKLIQMLTDVSDWTGNCALFKGRVDADNFNFLSFRLVCSCVSNAPNVLFERLQCEINSNVRGKPRESQHHT